MARWKQLSSELIYETPWIRVRRDEVLNHIGQPLTYSVVELKNPSVFVVATNDAGEIYLQQTYRYTLDMTMWELPAGHSETGDLLGEAQRELMEETGLVSDDWTHLGRLYQANGTGSIPLEAFWARQVRPAEGARDADEDIRNGHFVSLADFEEMARAGDFVESAHLACVYLAKLQGLGPK